MSEATLQETDDAAESQVIETEVTTDDQTEQTDDIDLLELNEAREALKSEGAESEEGSEDEAGDGEANAEPEPEPEKQDAQTAEGDKQDDPKTDGQQDPTMIPKARFDEVLQRGDEAARAAAYWKGVADGRINPDAKGDGEGGQEPTETPEQQIEGIRSELFNLAEQFDNGDLSMADFKRKEAELEDKIEEIRQEQNEQSQQAAAKDTGDQRRSQVDLYLEERTNQIAGEHPYMSMLDDFQTNEVSATRLSILNADARASLKQEGVELGDDARSTLVLRQRIADLSDKYGPMWFPDAQVGQQQPEQSGGQPANTGLTDKQKAVKAKVEEAAKHPPNTETLGTGEIDDTATVASATAKIESGEMTDEEIAALPPAVKSKIINGAFD